MQFNFNVSYEHHWRDLGIILGVAGFNVRHGVAFYSVRKLTLAWLPIGLVHVCGHVLFPDTQGYGVAEVGGSQAHVCKDRIRP